MKTKNETFWVIICGGIYVLNDHALTPVLANAQRFATREEARKNRKKHNPRNGEKIQHVEHIPESYVFI